MMNFENLEKAKFSGKGMYNIPEIIPENIDISNIKWIPFNYALSTKEEEEHGIHFYIDDYQFQRLWRNPDRYIDKIKKFKVVCSPGFSTYTDMPAAMQIYNHYRKHWIAAYWQLHGISVIPTISWSDKESFSWCFDGEPKNSIVSISSVGTQNSEHTKQKFREGLQEMIQRIEPSLILWHGKKDIDIGVKTIEIEPHYEAIVRRRKKWAEEAEADQEAGQHREE